MVTTMKRENPDSDNSKSTLHYEKPNYISFQVFKRQQQKNE